jgi:shikimate kinase
MRIYLLGYMGSGKTTFGRALAKYLKYTFIDLDHFIEEQHKKTIPQIFEQEGETQFRELEKSYLHQTSLFQNTIVSCGGGTPCFFDNMDWMNQNGTTLYLQMTVDGLFNRLSNAREERPLLKNLNPEEMKNFIGVNLQKRAPFYEQASHILNAEKVKPKIVAGLLMKP